jgi:hypothetical protein
MAGRIRQNLHDNAIGKFSGTLILFLNNTHLGPFFYIRPLSSIHVVSMPKKLGIKQRIAKIKFGASGSYRTRNLCCRTGRGFPFGLPVFILATAKDHCATR